VTLVAEYLQVGTNEVELDLCNKYRKDGVGIHSYIDKVDGE